jgi:hypothetical protein
MKPFFCKIGLHWHSLVFERGAYRYWQCNRCRYRSYSHIPSLVGPINRRWLNGGEWDDNRPRQLPAGSTPAGERAKEADGRWPGPDYQILNSDVLSGLRQLLEDYKRLDRLIPWPESSLIIRIPALIAEAEEAVRLRALLHEVAECYRGKGDIIEVGSRIDAMFPEGTGGPNA